jgi:hypothetical protein
LEGKMRRKTVDHLERKVLEKSILYSLWKDTLEGKRRRKTVDHLE